MSLHFKTAETYEEFVGILDLQQQNHIKNLDSIDQGFVFAEHSVEDLVKMNSFAPHIIAKDEDLVVAYILGMTVESRFDIEMLIPMFEQFDEIEVNGTPLSAYNYIVVGQVAVAKDYRGQGILTNVMHFIKKSMEIILTLPLPKFLSAITGLLWPITGLASGNSAAMSMKMMKFGLLWLGIGETERIFSLLFVSQT